MEKEKENVEMKKKLDSKTKELKTNLTNLK
jgi:hypothetical protein